VLACGVCEHVRRPSPLGEVLRGCTMTRLVLGRRQTYGGQVNPPA
jgi:hypothetical protein